MVAQTDATAWTSVEGTTIWAQLDGVEGDKVLLRMRGRCYRVPVSRLAPKSIEKLHRLLDRPLPPAEVAGQSGSVTGVRPPEPAMAPPPQHLNHHPTATKTANPAPVAAPVPRVVGRTAIAPSCVPEVIHLAVEAGNRLQTKSYKWGGGREPLEDTGYDCSGSVSYVLIKAGLLNSPLDSRGFAGYGAPGPGRWITIHASPGHVFVTICGLRLDTSGHGERGPRWRLCGCRPRGSVLRHPPGF